MEAYRDLGPEIIVHRLNMLSRHRIAVRECSREYKRRLRKWEAEGSLA